MAENHDSADVFAIPDFWKSSEWIEPSIAQPPNQFFSLNLAGKDVLVPKD
jgi:hypothetical protein